MKQTRDHSLDAQRQADEDATMVRRIKAGEQEAFAELVRAHGGRLLAVARRFLGDEHDAQDAVQDAFVSAFKSMDSFHGRSKLATWLHRIVVNSALMKLRSRKRKPERSIDDLLPSFLDDGHMSQPATQWAVTHDRAIGERETRELVRRRIEQLPESYRVVLLLRDIEGMNTEETAKTLGIAVGAVKTRLHRARQALRTLLDPDMRGETV